MMGTGSETRCQDYINPDSMATSVCVLLCHCGYNNTTADGER